MILNRQTLAYKDLPLIEKLTVQTPFRYKAWVENVGCFIFFKEVGSHIISPDGKAGLKPSESVLLKCGNHFVDLAKKKGDGIVEVVLIHLFPPALLEIYNKPLNAIFEKHENFHHLTIISPEVILEKFVETLDFYFDSPELVNDQITGAKIQELVELLIQTGNVVSVQALLKDLKSGPHAKLKSVVQEHLFSNISTSELAKLCSMSLSTFNRNFKKEFKETPISYINNKRIKKAKELLADLELSISEIAYDLGFNDPLYFSKTFKKIASQTPSEYRMLITN